MSARKAKASYIFRSLLAEPLQLDGPVRPIYISPYMVAILFAS
jgi:hypothetical protein